MASATGDTATITGNLQQAVEISATNVAIATSDQMSAPSFTVPTGDPGTVRQAAVEVRNDQRRSPGSAHAFNGQAQKALANWRGPVAEQYAVLAGDAARRYTAVVTALTAISRALTTYAGALETAQSTIGSLNRQVAAKNSASSQNQEARSLSGTESAAESTLSQAARTCAQALQSAHTTLAAQCPDIMSTAQLVQAVKNAESRLNNPQHGDNPVGLYSGLEYMLTSYALFAAARGGVKGANAGTELSESEKLLDALQTRSRRRRASSSCPGAGPVRASPAAARLGRHDAQRGEGCQGRQGRRAGQGRQLP